MVEGLACLLEGLACLLEGLACLGLFFALPPAALPHRWKRAANACLLPDCCALQCAAVRCSVLQCVAVRYSVLQCGALRSVAVLRQCVAVLPRDFPELVLALPGVPLKQVGLVWAPSL